MLKLGWSFPQP